MYDVNTNSAYITNVNADIITTKDTNQLVSDDNKHRFVFLPTGYWVKIKSKAIFNKIKAIKIE